MKKILATLVTAVVIGAGGLAVASATASTPASTTTTPSATKAAGTTVRRAAGRTIRRLAFATAAKTIGLSPADLLKAMKGGHSIADVATAHGVEPTKVVDAIVTTVDARIQQAVTSGAITSDQAAKLEQIVETRAPKLVNATPRQLARRRIVAGAIDVSAKTIGVTPAALREALAGGQSVAQVATAHGIDPAKVVTALVAAGNARIDRAVVNHHLSGDRAAKLKARLPQLAQRFVNRTRAAAATPAA